MFPNIYVVCLSYPKLLDSPIVQVDSVPTGGHEPSRTFLENSRGRLVCITKFSGDLNHNRNIGLEITFENRR